MCFSAESNEYSDSETQADYRVTDSDSGPIRKRTVTFSTVDQVAKYNIHCPPNMALQHRIRGSRALGETLGCHFEPVSWEQPNTPSWPDRACHVFRLVDAYEDPKKWKTMRVIHGTFRKDNELSPSHLQGEDKAETKAVLYLGEDFRFLSMHDEPYELHAMITCPRPSAYVEDWSDDGCTDPSENREGIYTIPEEEEPEDEGYERQHGDQESTESLGMDVLMNTTMAELCDVAWAMSGFEGETRTTDVGLKEKVVNSKASRRVDMWLRTLSMVSAIVQFAGRKRVQNTSTTLKSPEKVVRKWSWNHMFTRDGKVQKDKAGERYSPCDK